MAEKFAWLIEHWDRYPLPKWPLPGTRIQWTTDAFKALRFATEDECRAVMRHPDFRSDLGNCIPTEHGFQEMTHDSHDGPSVSIWEGAT